MHKHCPNNATHAAADKDSAPIHRVLVVRIVTCATVLYCRGHCPPFHKSIAATLLVSLSLSLSLASNPSHPGACLMTPQAVLFVLLMLSAASFLPSRADGCYDTSIVGNQQGASWTDVNYVTCGDDWLLSLEAWSDVNDTLCGVYAGYTNGASSYMHGVEGVHSTLVNLDVGERITNMSWYGDVSGAVSGFSFATNVQPNATVVGDITGQPLLWSTDYHFTEPNTYVVYLEGRVLYDKQHNATRISGLGIGYYTSSSDERTVLE